MKKICYIVLHFLNDAITTSCVESLLKNIGIDSQIIIIDNGSQNGSYDRLFNQYFDNKQVSVYSTHENMGFAKGNNFGYAIAKEMFDVQYIVFCNNDLIFEDKDFEKKLISENESLKYDVLGPDIVDLNGVHQNPHRTALLTLSEIRQKNIKKMLFLTVLKMKKKIKFLKKITFLEREFEFESTITTSVLPSENIVLQGACIIVGERFIKNEEKVFCEETFLYFEEDLLSLYCKMKNYSVNVIKDIHVKHLEGISTKGVMEDDVDRWIFRISNLIKSGMVYEKKLKEFERRI